ncbi:hypothetical protein HUS23_12550 [Ectothiorhodospiraceae bacterium 2226]|nr:hypothetical protein HUS23_12550 [Ectothiorhodospiraceae bacterium 2226]
MIALKRLPLWLGAALAISGCTYIPPPDGPRYGSARIAAPTAAQAAQIEHALDGGYYEWVLAAIATLPNEHPDYQRWQRELPEIRTRAASYERAKVRRGEDQLEAGAIHEALQTFTRGLEKLPSSEALKKAHKAAEARRMQREVELTRMLTIEQAQWLLNEGRLVSALAELAPGDEALRERVVHNQTAQARVAGRLGRMGGEALQENNLAAAEKLFALALALNPESGLEQNLAEVRSTQRARAVSAEQEQRRRVARTREAEAERLATSADAALQQGALVEAGELLQRLEALEGAARHAEDLRIRLQAAIAERVERDLERGRVLYSRGAIDAALDIWRPLQAVAPEHPELRANVERAERVLERLRQLRGRES